MDIFQKLKEAKSEIAFFTAVATLTTQHVFTSVWGEIRITHNAEHGDGLAVWLTQRLSREFSNGRKMLYSKQTHQFMLYSDNTLIWKITDGSTLTGLAEIQQGLQHLSSVHDDTLIDSKSGKQKLHIPHFWREDEVESKRADERAKSQDEPTNES